MRTTAILIALSAIIFTTSAQARLHPQEEQPRFIDAAAVPAYTPETASVVRHQYTRHAKPEHRVHKHSIERHKEARREAPERPTVHAPVQPRQTPLEAILAAVGALWGLPDRPFVAHTPARISGEIEIAGATFPFGSGGHGWSIPYGDYLITPKDVGSWGSRHGALGIAGGEIYDKRLGRDRIAIELHHPTNGALMTAGCVAVENWESFKRKVLAMIDQFGHAFLHIDPRGSRVSPHPDPIMVADVRVEVGEVRARHRHYTEHRHHRVRYASR